MSRRRRKAQRGLGAVNPDATAAIAAARQGKCKSALRYLYDASPHVQSHTPGEKHRQDFKVASIIVAQHCGGGERPKSRRVKTPGGKTKRYFYPGFEGVRSMKRVRRRRR